MYVLSNEEDRIIKLRNPHEKNQCGHLELFDKNQHHLIVYMMEVKNQHSIIVHLMDAVTDSKTRE